MREFCKYRLITGMQHGYCFFIVIISACTCFEKNGELGIRTAGAYATHQIKIRCLKIRLIQLYIHVDPRHDGWKQMQVHTKRSLTTIPTCGRQGSTTTNTKLTYNLFTPGPSVRLVENLAEDQLPLLLLLQVPEVVLVHHPVGPLLVEVLVGVQHQNLFCCPSAGR